VTKVVKDRTIVMLMLPVAAAGFALLPVPGTAWGMLGALALAALGMGLAGPNLNGMVSKAAGERAQGIAMGATQSISSLGLVVGPLLATMLYDHVGMSWPFYSAAAFIMLGWVVMSFVAVDGEAAKQA
jgi:MFS family permease